MRFISTKGQVWTLDFIIGIVLFVLVGIVFYVYTINILPQQRTFGQLEQDAASIASGLVSAGFPLNWTPSTVQSVGMSDGNGRLDTQKLVYLTSISYKDTRNYLGTSRHFVLFFEDKDGAPLTINGTTQYGKAGVTKSNVLSAESPDHLATVYRLLFYNGQIIRVGVYVW